MTTLEIAIRRVVDGAPPSSRNRNTPKQRTRPSSLAFGPETAQALLATALHCHANGEVVGKKLFTGSNLKAFGADLTTPRTFSSAQSVRQALGLWVVGEDSELQVVRRERLCASIDDSRQRLGLCQEVPFSLNFPTPIDKRFLVIGKSGSRAPHLRWMTSRLLPRAHRGVSDPCPPRSPILATSHVRRSISIPPNKSGPVCFARISPKSRRAGSASADGIWRATARAACQT